MVKCRGCGLVSAVLLCSCLAQGVSAPPAAAVGKITSILISASTTGDTGDLQLNKPIPDLISGRVYQAPARPVRFYVEVDKPPPKQGNNIEST